MGEAGAASARAARRAALVERLVDHVLAHGLGDASLRALARGAGTSDRMLLYYFKDKAELIAAVLEGAAARMTAVLGASIAPRPLPLRVLRRTLAEQLLGDAAWPYMRLWLEIASRAAGGDAVCRAVGGQIGRGFLAWAAPQIDCPDHERAAKAARLMVAIEGMVLLNSIDMGDVAALAR